MAHRAQNSVGLLFFTKAISQCSPQSAEPHLGSAA
jgi:hypothetical protein